MSNCKWKIFSNFVAFSEYPNFNSGCSAGASKNIQFSILKKANVLNIKRETYFAPNVLNHCFDNKHQKIPPEVKPHISLLFASNVTKFRLSEKATKIWQIRPFHI